MIKSWYHTPERIKRHESVALSWWGTPFRPNSAARGEDGGVSCQNLLAQIEFETGFHKRFEVPQASAGWSKTKKMKIMEDYMNEQMAHRYDPLDPAKEWPIPGDVLGFRVHSMIFHFGKTLINGRFIHVRPRKHVIVSELSDTTYANRLQQIWRPIA